MSSFLGRVHVDIRDMIVIRVEVVGPPIPSTLLAQRYFWDIEVQDSLPKPKPPRKPQKFARKKLEPSYPLLDFRWPRKRGRPPQKQQICPKAPEPAPEESAAVRKSWLDDIQGRLEDIEDILCDEDGEYSLPSKEWDLICHTVLPERYKTPPMPKSATKAQPKTAAKVRALADRQAQGEHLWHPDDISGLADRLGLRTPRAGNNRRRAATYRDEDGEVQLVESEVYEIVDEEDGEDGEEETSGFISMTGCLLPKQRKNCWSARKGEPESGCRRTRECR